MSNKIPTKVIVSSIRAAKSTVLGTMLSAACVLLMLTPALAQQAVGQNASIESVPKDIMTSIEIPAQPDAIDLGTGPLPDANTPESWHRQYGSKFARNVSIATLTPFLPEPAKATGTAVIVAPGGGFRTLSMENEGWQVASALADKGVAAFVLKYRLNQTAPDLKEFAKPTHDRLRIARLQRVLHLLRWPHVSLRKLLTQMPLSRSFAPMLRNGMWIQTALA